MSNNSSLERATSEIVSSRPPVVVFGIGIPGSGKSTFLQQLGRELATDPINVDGYRNRMMATGWSIGGVDRLNHQIATDVANRIMQGGVALIDSTNCHAEFRQKDIELYRSLGARTIGAIFLDTPLDIAIARDAERQSTAHVGAQTIKSMHTALQAQQPTQSEGFDWVIKQTL